MAAIETIKYIIKNNEINKIKKFSNNFTKEVNKMIIDLKLNTIFKIEGVWWRPAFGVYEGVDKQYLQILRKNLIKNKLLIGNSFNFCYAHTNIKIYK